MPVYMFKCQRCSTIVEHSFKMSEYDAVKDEIELNGVCEGCGATALKRTIDSPDFVLKGERWAKDGYNYINYAELQK